MRRAGCTPVVVCAADQVDRTVAALADVPGPVPVYAFDSTALRNVLEGLGEQVVILAEANALYDERLLHKAASWTRPTRMIDSRSDVGQLCGLRAIRACDFSTEGIVDGQKPSDIVDIADIPTYSKSLRRELALFIVPVRNSSDIAKARDALARSAGKGHQEFMVHLLNRPAETWISRWLAELPITPNQITIICNLLALGVAIFFSQGWFWAGILMALAVGIADGLDGRQARIQVKTSRLGEFEHLLDKVYETAWTIAIAWYFRDAAGGVAWWLAGTWFLAYILDNVAYSFFRARRQYMIDEASSFDGAVRFVASCKNTNVFILLVGLIANRPIEACVFIVVWGVITAAVHWLRVLMLLRRPVDVSGMTTAP